MKHRAVRVLASLLQIAALAGVVFFAWSFGLRWGVLAGAVAAFVVGFALDGDLR